MTRRLQKLLTTFAALVAGGACYLCVKTDPSSLETETISGASERLGSTTMAAPVHLKNSISVGSIENNRGNFTTEVEASTRVDDMNDSPSIVSSHFAESGVSSQVEVAHKTASQQPLIQLPKPVHFGKMPVFFQPELTNSSSLTTEQKTTLAQLADQISDSVGEPDISTAKGLLDFNRKLLTASDDAGYKYRAKYGQQAYNALIAEAAAQTSAQ